MPNTFKRGKLVVERRGEKLIFNTGHHDPATLYPTEAEELLRWLQPSLNERVAQEVMERAALPDYTPETNESQAFEAFRHVLPSRSVWAVDADNVVWVDSKVLGRGKTLAIAFCHAALHLAAQS